MIETSGITDPTTIIRSLEATYGKMYRVRLDCVATVRQQSVEEEEEEEEEEDDGEQNRDKEEQGSKGDDEKKAIKLLSKECLCKWLHDHLLLYF